MIILFLKEGEIYAKFSNMNFPSPGVVRRRYMFEQRTSLQSKNILEKI